MPSLLPPRLAWASACVLVLACAPSDDLASEGDDAGDGDSSTTALTGHESAATQSDESHGLEEGGASGGSEDATDTGEPCGPTETTEVEGCPAIVGEGFCPDSSKHVTTDTVIEWSHNPPHSGDHFPIWETKGEHEEVVERGYWVHNLEHGWIVLVYNCQDQGQGQSQCEQELDVLREVIAARPDLSILMTEDPLLDAPRFAALSWSWVYEFDTPVLDELLCFVDQHWDHAPESVP